MVEVKSTNQWKYNTIQRQSSSSVRLPPFAGTSAPTTAAVDAARTYSNYVGAFLSMGKATTGWAGTRESVRVRCSGSATTSANALGNRKVKLKVTSNSKTAVTHGTVHTPHSFLDLYMLP